MNQSPEQRALQHHMAICQGHAEALQDALQDMQNRALNVDDYDALSKQIDTSSPSVIPDLIRDPAETN